MAATDTCNVGVKGSTPFVSTKVTLVRLAVVVATGSIKWPQSANWKQRMAESAESAVPTTAYTNKDVRSRV